jgi:hypothetical protein
MPPRPVPVPYTSNPELAPRILTEEDKHDIAERRKLEDAARAAEEKAKFKIELMFTSQFSIIKPVQGVMSFFESGSQLHGGGDTIIHFCPGKMLKRSDCEHYIPDPSHGYGFLVCPKCNTLWQGKDVYGQVFARLTAQKWAELICTYYHRLDMNCDVVIKYHREDIRNATRSRHIVDSLGSVRSAQKRLKRIYTLKSLIKDLSSGASLYDRILAFVRA